MRCMLTTQILLYRNECKKAEKKHTLTTVSQRHADTRRHVQSVFASNQVENMKNFDFHLKPSPLRCQRYSLSFTALCVNFIELFNMCSISCNSER